MDLLSKELLKNLVKKNSDPCISIYIPTHREWNEQSQDRTRFKNHLQKIYKQLNERGMRANRLQQLMKPVFDLLDDIDFWNHQSEGLAVFFSPDEFQRYRIPIRVQELNIISQRYYIKPLLSLLSGDGRFFLLALDQKIIKLFQGSKYSINEIKLPKGTFVSLKDYFQFEEADKSYQLYGGNTATEGASFFTHGSVRMDAAVHKEKILEFFKLVNKGVFQVIKNENAPLVLAGVEYLIPLYKEANSYPYLAGESLDINPEGLKNEELHRSAWEIVHPMFEKNRMKALKLYEQFSGNGRASSSIEEVVKAAFNKKVESLFVNKDAQVWGKYNPEEDEVIVDEAHSESNEELLDLAAVQTFVNNGSVFVLGKDKMPCDKPAAAVFRY
jgi:hypothetical protein